MPMPDAMRSNVSPAGARLLQRTLYRRLAKLSMHFKDAHLELINQHLQSQGNSTFNTQLSARRVEFQDVKVVFPYTLRIIHDQCTRVQDPQFKLLFGKRDRYQSLCL